MKCHPVRNKDASKAAEARKVAGPAVPKLLQSSMKFPLSRGIGQYDQKNDDKAVVLATCRQLGSSVGESRTSGWRGNTVRKAVERYNP